MRKFVLIDQSIKNAGGHHLEYALRVLKAAKAQGMETILAVNKKCDPIQSQFIDQVEYIFTNTFWENMVKSRGRRLIGGSKFLGLMRSIKNDLLYKILYSQTGMIYNELRSQSTLKMIKNYVGKEDVGSLSAFRIVLTKLLLTIIQGVKSILQRINRLFYKLGPFGRILRRLCLFVIILLLSPLILLYLIPQYLVLKKAGPQYNILFAKEVCNLLSRSQIKSNDVTFVPTLGETELQGLLELSQNLKIEQPAWHLLFRRNLFNGRNPSYSKQFEETQEARIVFNRFVHEKEKGQFYFYTDTDHLTKQYNSLGAMKFTTLPIPHDSTLQKSKTQVGNGPLVISYIGDARTEKGFQALPKLISDLEAKGIDAGQVHYRFQSNFNVPEGEPAPRVAKAVLSNYSENYIELLEGPFNSEEYASLINDSDIVLIPYDSNNYYARSSGVLAEALVAGIPVVVPAGTWMSSAFTQEVQNYLKKQFKESLINLNSSLNFPSIDVCVPKQISNLILELEWNYPSEGMQCHLQVQRQVRPSDEDQQCFWIDSNSDTLVLEPIADKVYCCIRSNEPGCYKISLNLNDSTRSFNDIDQLKAQIKNVTVKGIETEIPSGVIGATYYNINRVSDSVRELINHYPHYLEGALTYKQKWYAEHSAENLVHQLVSQSQNGDGL
ncbi:glycosyltransferase [Gimesia aquarii]|uniref:Glycosyl transferases group 1 n=1 Tax=Gimesia aquarii TaxID=2527964 RepID=A0A517W3V1_9PLAN|nr:glycosyltransferase [Gimesia aquarii]QDT99932.1 hypothetical protein V144x_54460 [Gimesia aquarii]